MDSKTKAPDPRAFARGAKWTALQPKNREKHFVVHSQIERAGGVVDSVRVEAVLTKTVYAIAVSELGDATRWRPGWH